MDTKSILDELDAIELILTRTTNETLRQSLQNE